MLRFPNQPQPNPGSWLTMQPSAMKQTNTYPIAWTAPSLRIFANLTLRIFSSQKPRQQIWRYKSWRPVADVKTIELRRIIMIMMMLKAMKTHKAYIHRIEILNNATIWTQILLYCMSKKKWPILYSKLLYKIGQYFLNRQYDLEK